MCKPLPQITKEKLSSLRDEDILLQKILRVFGDYKVIINADLDEFQKEVKSAIANGYNPQGGLTISDGKYHQAMCKPLPQITKHLVNRVLDQTQED